MSLHCSPEVIQISQHNISNATGSVGFVSKSASCFLPSVCSIPMSSERYLSLTSNCRTSMFFWNFVIHRILGKYDGIGECDVRARCCPKINEASHCLAIWNLAAVVFVVIAFFANGRCRHTFRFRHVEFLQCLIRTHLSDLPITLTLNMHSGEASQLWF